MSRLGFVIACIFTPIKMHNIKTINYIKQMSNSQKNSFFVNMDLLINKSLPRLII